mmetsp:Transcript_23471/g.62015  ORF Transcript_23471/g.62015 Transcript_23471/m.62015 type:complete len:209 (+) Transcript_23471:2-628(+)
MAGEGKQFNSMPFRLRAPPAERAKRKALPITYENGVKLLRTEPHGYIPRPWMSDQLLLIAREQRLALSETAQEVADALDPSPLNALWQQLDPAEVAAIEAAWAASCARPVSKYASKGPPGRVYLKHRWEILHQLVCVASLRVAVEEAATALCFRDDERSCTVEELLTHIRMQKPHLATLALDALEAALGGGAFDGDKYMHVDGELHVI